MKAMVIARWVWRGLTVLAVAFMLVHFWDGLRYWAERGAGVGRDETVVSSTGDASWTANQRDAFAAIHHMLEADGVADAEAWARSIVTYAPTSDRGYLALVLAMIRRESAFNAPDIEWLFDRVVPESLHEWGVADPVTTVGPMQIKLSHLERLSDAPDRAQLKREMSDIDQGVFAAIVYLDGVIREYFPDRRPGGWASLVGRKEYAVVEQQTYQPNWGAAETRRRWQVASLQKMLSDLTGRPLVLDGAAGARTLEAARRCASMLPAEEQQAFAESLVLDLIGSTGEVRETLAFRAVRREWEAVYGPGRDELFPRLSHDPRVSFVFADFNVGPLAARLAALQHMAGTLLGIELVPDGLYGAETRAALTTLVEALDLTDDERAEWHALIESPGNKRGWVIRRLHTLVGERWEAQRGTHPPYALVPRITTHRVSQDIKSIGPMTVRDYVVGGCGFYERYYARLTRIAGE